MKFIRNFLQNESGATSVEYAMLLALLAAAMIATAFTAGGVSAATWGGNAEAIVNAVQ